MLHNQNAQLNSLAIWFVQTSPYTIVFLRVLGKEVKYMETHKVHLTLFSSARTHTRTYA